MVEHNFELIYRKELDNLQKLYATVVGKDKFSRKERAQICEGLLSCLDGLIQLKFMNLSQLSLEPSRDPQKIAQQLDAIDMKKVNNCRERTDILYKLFQDIDSLYLRKSFGV